MTETGLSLGTPHYMSPEQATADKDLTNRSDIYSLGAMLYEMLTGDPPHTGSSAQQIIMKIVTEEVPPVTKVRKSVPPNVAAATATALEKLPADRFETANDFAQALVNTGYTRTDLVGATALPSVTRRSRVMATAGIALGLVAGVVLGWATFRRAPTARPLLTRITVQADSTHTVSNWCCGPSIAFSRNGQVLAFLATGPNGFTVFIRRLDEFAGRAVPGTEGASTPFLSPDGRRLGFLQEGVLKSVDLSGGAPRTIADIGGRVRGADWTEDDLIYFGNATDGGIYRVSAQGGTPELVTLPDTAAGEARRGLPHLLPGGRALLFATWNAGPEDAAIHVMDLERRTSRRLVSGSQPQYVEGGYLVFVRSDGSLMAQHFDPRAYVLQGDAIRMAENLIVHSPSPEAEMAVSKTGSIAYRQGASAESALEEFTIEGRLVATHTGRDRRSAPRYSPDGRQIAYAQIRGNSEYSDIWVLDLVTGIETRVSSGGRDRAPVWSPDGRSILWSAVINTPPDSAVVMSRPADLSAPATPLGAGGASGLLGIPARAVGPIPFMHFSNGTLRGIWIVEQNGSNPRAWHASQQNDLFPALSPSGKWIAYASDQSGTSEIYIQPFPAGGPITRVSPNGGTSPVWVSDQRLLYRGVGYSSELRSVHLDMTGPRPRPIGYQLVVAAVAAYPAPWGHNYSVSPDGKRVVVLRQSGESTLLVELNRLQHLNGVSR